MNISDVIVEQTIIPYQQEHKFICSDCACWIKNTVGCKKNYFISTVGAYIPTCSGFVPNNPANGEKG